MAARANRKGAGRPRKDRTAPKTKRTAPKVGLKTADRGLLKAIERLRDAELSAAHRYQQALALKDDGKIQTSLRDWRDVIEILRKVEISTPEVLRLNEDTLPKSEVREVVSEMVLTFRSRLEAIPRSMPARLVGQAEADIQLMLEKSVNDCLDALHSGKW